MIRSAKPERTWNIFRSVRRERQRTGKRQLLAKALRRLGVSWEAAPARRVIQAVCLLLYCDLFFRVCWPYTALASGHVVELQEWVPVELFLWLDPLVGLSTAIAARLWSVAIIGMAVVLGLGVVMPRAFCGYICPLGTLIDAFDFLVGKRIHLFKSLRITAWSNFRFYLLAGVLAASLAGVLVTGFVAAIPVLTRGLLFSASNVQLGLARNWGMVPPLSAAIWLSLGLFMAVFLPGLLAPRFWCRYICPSGALLSLPGLLRTNTRQVSSDLCIGCGKCVEACPFDAIQPDFGTRTLNCTFCQTCGGVCPTEAISFVPASNKTPTHVAGVRLAQPVNRRVMLGSVAAGVISAFAVHSSAASSRRPIRPPGSVAEAHFLDLCIRCEQCLKVCPGPVLQPAGLEYGFEALWTPVAVFPHAGCHQNCNLCTEACPTGAIEPLSLARKRKTVMGRALIDTGSCLPHRGEQDCRLCADECDAAGYRAIEMRPIQLPTGPVPEGAFSPEEIEQMGQILAPFVDADACVGCGLCEYRCHSVWVGRQKVLSRSAVAVKPPRT